MLLVCKISVLREVHIAHYCLMNSYMLQRTLQLVYDMCAVLLLVHCMKPAAKSMLF